MAQPPAKGENGTPSGTPIRLRRLALALAGCLAVYCALFFHDTHAPVSRLRNIGSSVWSRLGDVQPGPGGAKLAPLGPVLQNLGLTAEQCETAFPGLTREVERAVGEGKFVLKEREILGPLVGRIVDGRLYVVSQPAKGDLAAHMRERQAAALHQIHIALITSPTPLPNTTFTLSVQDSPIPQAWCYARPIASPRLLHTFPMPHFSLWSWPIPFLSSLPLAALSTTHLESHLPFSSKSPLAIWRGTAWFNNPAGANPHLRQDLLRVTKNASWADVQSLRSSTASNPTSNGIPIGDFCRYRYIIYTEGVSYSGRLHFHQLCASVLLSPPIEWMQHTTHLVKPVYSTMLLRGRDALEQDAAGKRRYPSQRARGAWPVEVAVEEANMVFVAPDWSDLGETVKWLEEHLDVAEGIARRQREVFAGKGYLSPAAETCYWRALIRGWSEVVQMEEGTFGGDGVSFEQWSVTAVSR